MADLISREALLKELATHFNNVDGRTLYHPSMALAMHDVRNAPAVDAVSRGLFEQIKWERDIAMEQLTEHGIAFGAKSDPASLRPKGECKFCSKEDNGALCWDCSDLGISIEYRAGRIRVTNEYGDEAYLGVHFCPNCGADMRAGRVSRPYEEE